jgi:hypothetical protein
MAVARDARKEAFERLGGRHEVRVLEPSPPAIRTPGVVEDQVARGEVPSGRKLVSPVTSGDVLWEDLAAGDKKLASWCAERWLAAYPKLKPAPAELAQTREALHLVAENVIAPTRARDHGEITLRWTLGGFGTPFFGNDSQLRIEGDLLVVQRGDEVTSGRLTTLPDAAEFVGFDLTRFEGLSHEALGVDVAASQFLGDVYGFGFSVLEELRAESHALEPSLVNLWPEHFDVAVELGGEKAGHRAAYGLSPGDANHPEPYLYVAPWTARPAGDLWNAAGFPGAELAWADLIKAKDQRQTALEFFQVRLRELNPPQD